MYLRLSDYVLRRRERLVLCRLLADARMPDKHIAQEIGATQTTVTRIRQKLERNGYIESYRARGNLKKAGLSIIVTTLFEWTDYAKSDIFDAAKKYILSDPYIMFFGRGEGMSGKTHIIISVHRDFEEYDRFMHGLRRKWDKYLRNVNYFMTSVDGVFKRFSTKDAIIHSVMEEETNGR